MGWFRNKYRHRRLILKLAETASEFTPLSLSPGIWYDGNIGLSGSEGDPVSTFPDQSGNAFDAGSSGTDRPALTIETLAGNTGVVFESANSEHLIVNNAPTGTVLESGLKTSHTILIALKPTDGQPTTNQMPWGVQGTSTANQAHIQHSLNGKIRYQYRANNQLSIAESANALFADGAVAEPHLLTVVADHTVGGVGGIVLYFDGAAVTLGASNGDTTGVDFSAFSSPYNPAFGARNSGGTDVNHWDGSISDVYFTPSALSGDDLTNLHTYFKDKYNL